jgi:hypothetical protein
MTRDQCIFMAFFATVFPPYPDIKLYNICSCFHCQLISGSSLRSFTIDMSISRLIPYSVSLSIIARVQDFLLLIIFLLGPVTNLFAHISAGGPSTVQIPFYSTWLCVSERIVRKSTMIASGFPLGHQIIKRPLSAMKLLKLPNQISFLCLAPFSPNSQL